MFGCPAVTVYWLINLSCFFLNNLLFSLGRYLFLNAMANQLRYPNSHTHYFSCTLLYLFAEANTEAIQEQITRVLLERLIVNRPHPWGLLITFIELIKNPQFKFWTHEFVRCAPEIEKWVLHYFCCCLEFSHQEFQFQKIRSLSIEIFISAK